MKNKSLLMAITLVSVGIVAGVILVSTFGAGHIGSLFAAGGDIGAKNPPVQPDGQMQAINKAYVAVSKAVMPTVVSISVTTERKGSTGRMQIPDELRKFFGNPFDDQEGESDAQPFRSEASGSGVFMSEDGYIVTNNHVVEDAKEIKVTTHDNHEYKARLIGRDPLTDLAVIKVEGNNFPVAFIANSDEAQVGEWVVAVGNPLGLTSTITAGIVSAIGRGNIGLGKQSYSIENYIQTDAAINPGNSGGGLFDLEGRLVGINTAIATRTGYYQGYGFAIPSNLVKAVVLDLLDDGKVNRGYVGVQIRTVNEADAKALGLSQVAGVLVQDVIKGGAAEKAGLESGDVILELDGISLKTSNELQNQVGLRRAGQTVSLKIWRDGKMMTKSVTLKARDEKDDLAFASPGENERKSEPDEDMKPLKLERYGFSVEPLDRKTKEDGDYTNGVIVKKVDSYSEASRRGIFPNDVIVKADRKSVNSPRDLKAILDSKKGGEAVLLHIKNKNGTKVVGIEAPNDKP